MILVSLLAPGPAFVLGVPPGRRQRPEA
jgi:hypothetical protein